MLLAVALGRAVVLISLISAQPARAADAEEVPPDKLPPKVTEELSNWSKDAEVVAATREREDGKECYLVTLVDKGQRMDLYVAPDGRFCGRKEQEVTGKDLSGLLLAALGLSVIPGAIGAAGARILIQCLRLKRRSELLEWTAAWFGGAIVMGILWSMLATLRLHRDLIVVVLLCSIVGGISASIIQIVALTIQWIRGCRTASPLWIFVFFLIAVTILCLAIPFEVLRRQRFNQAVKAHALRPVPVQEAVP